MILVVDESLRDYKKIDTNSFAELNIWERKHIQEWVRENPEILGEELLVVAVEFDRFVQSKDRLDILAIDRDGNLVVIELKRDYNAGYADLQAIRYAAMVSTMTIEMLIPYYIEYQKKYSHVYDISENDARTNILEFVNSDNFNELSNRPRIILCSEDFSQEITATVLWLNANGLDISCVKIKPHKVDDKIIIVPNKIIPLQEANQYLIDIQKKGDEEVKQRKARPKTMKLLLENNLLKEGDVIYLKNALPAHLKFVDDDPTFIATITGKTGQSNAIRWKKDGEEYSISALTWKIFKTTHPEQKDPGGINGNAHWVTEEGKNLWEIAQEFWETNYNKK